MAHYMISVWHEDDYDLDFSGPEARRVVSQVEIFNNALSEAGSFVFAAGLQPRSTAEVMRSENGSVIATDGPFVEAKEHIGGFWIIDAANVEDARDWARQAAAACEGPVELRPLQGEE